MRNCYGWILSIAFNCSNVRCSVRRFSSLRRSVQDYRIQVFQTVAVVKTAVRNKCFVANDRFYVLALQGIEERDRCTYCRDRSRQDDISNSASFAASFLIGLYSLKDYNLYANADGQSPSRRLLMW